jgi:cytochrome P450
MQKRTKFLSWHSQPVLPLTKKIFINKYKNKNNTKNVKVKIFSTYFQNTAKYYLSLSKKHGNNFSSFVSKYLIIYAFDNKSVHEINVTKSNFFLKGSLWGRTRRFIGNGLLTSEDPKHSINKRIIQKSFHTKKIDEYIPIMIDKTKLKILEWDKNSINTIDLHSEMISLTLDIISSCLFGIDIEKKKSLKIEKDLDVSVAFAERTFSPSLHRFEYLPLPVFRKFEKSVNNLYNFSLDIVDEVIQNPKNSNNLIFDLLQYKDENGVGLSKEEICDEIITIILAGFESTANILTWSICYLNLYPDYYDKVINESKEVAKYEDSNFFIDKIKNAKFCEFVLKETLRLMPPIWQNPRTAKEDVEINNKFIPKGSFVILSPYVTHRNENLFINPNKFIPERWDNEFEKSLPKGSYFPFGSGARKCVGDQFAMIEMKIILLLIFSKIKIKTIGRFPTESATVTYRPAYSVKSKIQYH